LYAIALLAPALVGLLTVAYSSRQAVEPHPSPPDVFDAITEPIQSQSRLSPATGQTVNFAQARPARW